MPSSSLFLRSSATLVSILSLLAVPIKAYSSHSYELDTTYAGDTFFDGFDFFTEADPSHGFVTYVDESTAESTGLIKTSTDGSVIIGVDSTHTYNSSQPYWLINGVGRPSVRITSTKKYNHGLFIADISHMPGGVCGTWPALWTLGDGPWPYHGEIDILEGDNDQTVELSSLHTAGQCSIAGDSRTETGSFQASNCTYDVNTGANSAGCSVASTDTKSFGLDFNSNNGGVYAMQWTSDYIKIWFWPRGSIPHDIEAGKPSPDGWGLPTTNFQGDCDIDSNFINHQIVLDVTFCGDLAGGTWANSCAAKTGYASCADYVGDNPSAFVDMFWDINSIKVYQLTPPNDNSSTTSTPSTTPSVTASATTSSGCPAWTDGCSPPAYLTNLPPSIQAELPAWTGSPPADWCSYTSWMKSYTSANSVYASCSAKAASNSSYYTCSPPTRSTATPTGNTTTTTTKPWSSPTATEGSTGSDWGNDPTGVTYVGSVSTTTFSLTTGWAQSSLAAPPMGGDGNIGGTISISGTAYTWGSDTLTDPASKTTTATTWASWSDPSSPTLDLSSTATWTSWSDPSSSTLDPSSTTTWGSWSDPSSPTSDLSSTTTWGSWSDPSPATSTHSSPPTTWDSWTTAASMTSTPTTVFAYTKTSWTYDPASSSMYWALAGVSSSSSTLVMPSGTSTAASWTAVDPTATGPDVAPFTGAASAVGVSVASSLAMLFVGLLFIL